MKTLYCMLMAALPVLALTAGAQPAMDNQGGGSIRDLRPFEVVDANGKSLGRLLEPYLVQMRAGSERVLVQLDASGNSPSLMAFRNGRILYADAGCTGTGYLQSVDFVELGAPIGVTRIDSSGHVLLYAATGDYVSFAFKSWWSGLQCNEEVDSSFGLRLQSPQDITDLYKPPLRVK